MTRTGGSIPRRQSRPHDWLGSRLRVPTTSDVSDALVAESQTPEEILTTSGFSVDAIDYAGRVENRLVACNGESGSSWLGRDADRFVAPPQRSHCDARVGAPRSRRPSGAICYQFHRYRAPERGTLVSVSAMGENAVIQSRRAPQREDTMDLKMRKSAALER